MGISRETHELKLACLCFEIPVFSLAYARTASPTPRVCRRQAGRLRNAPRRLSGLDLHRLDRDTRGIGCRGSPPARRVHAALCSDISRSPLESHIFYIIGTVPTTCRVLCISKRAVNTDFSRCCPKIASNIIYLSSLPSSNIAISHNDYH